jgi:thiol-disulfide isomerase/thioredoxin
MMKSMRATPLITAILYGAFALFATPAVADLSADQVTALKEARVGDMKKMIIHNEPRPRLERQFENRSGAGKNVEDWGGKVVVLNFWATWCPPCRKEMPSLDRLQGAMGDDGFEVLALSMDRASVEKIDNFFMSIDVENLDVYREPSLRIGTEAGILGMPITLVLDRQGREIARLQGEAEWDGPNALALLNQIIAAVDAGES